MQVEALLSMTCTIVCTEVGDNAVKYGAYRSKTLLLPGAFGFAEDFFGRGQTANDGECMFCALKCLCIYSYSYTRIIGSSSGAL